MKEMQGVKSQQCRIFQFKEIQSRKHLSIFRSTDQCYASLVGSKLGLKGKK